MPNDNDQRKPPWRVPTRLHDPAELERMRQETAKPLPLLLDADEGTGVESTEVTVPGQRRAPTAEAPVVESKAALPDHVNVSLEVVGGPATGITYDLVQMETAVGRATPSISIDDPKLSRQHAMFVYRDGCFRVRDLGSANGLYLNGARVTDYPLRDGDKLLLGDTTIVFRETRRSG